MRNDDARAGRFFDTGSPGGARLKRVIILPFFIVTALGFALSWIIYIDGSRAALRDAVTAIMRESSERVSENISRRLEDASILAGADAAFLGAFPQSPSPETEIRRVFVAQLRANPAVAILAVGTEDGEYLEAQRLEDGSIRVGGAGRVTGGTLIFRPILGDGSFGEPSQRLPGYDPRERPWYKATIAAGGPSWSAPYMLYSDSALAIATAVPVYAKNRLIGVASATITLNALSGYLRGMKEAENGLIYVADGDGRLIASSVSDILGADGKRAFAASHSYHLISAAAGASSRAGERYDATGTRRFSFDEGGERYLGTATRVSQGSSLDWGIVFAVRERAYAQKLLEADRRNLIILSAFLLASLIVGYKVVEYVTRPIRAIADCVDALSPGEPAPKELTQFSTRKNELGRLSRSFLAMKIRLDDSFGAIEASLSEKDVLLKEVHHRVKNNLQIVSSLLSLQAGSMADEAARIAFDECQSRIQAMALVHEEVYQSGSFAELDMAAYLRKICESTVRVDVDADAVLTIEKAIPCGLIVNELVSNAVKHAFRGRASGSIAVSFHKEGRSWRLIVSDDGVGLPFDAAPNPGSDYIGTQLVEGLAAQLGGSMRYDSPLEGGTRVTLTF